MGDPRIDDHPAAMFPRTGPSRFLMTKILGSSLQKSFHQLRGVLALALAAAATLACAQTGFAGDSTDSKDTKAVIEKKAESRVKFSYLLDAGITAGTGAPKDNQLFGRLFDDRNGEPLVNQATFTVERALVPEPGKLDYGFKLQITGGTDARFLNPIGEFDRLSNGRYTFAVVEAYSNLHLPYLTAGGLDFRLGQFASPMSAETIYPPGNFFYSHSYLFNFGVPFQHVGALATLHATKSLDLYAGVVRGTNVGLDDNNDVLSFLGGFMLTLLDGKVVLAGNTSIGAENDAAFQGAIGNNGHRVDTNGDLRYYNNVNLTYKATDKLTFITDLVFTRDDGFQAECYGVAQYATFTLNKYVSLGIRGEVFRDEDGFFVTQFAANDDVVDLQRGDLSNIDPRTVGAGGGTTIGAVTVGVNLKPNDHVLIRPELRYDKALEGRLSYTDSTQSHQFTGGIDVIVTF